MRSTLLAKTEKVSLLQQMLKGLPQLKILRGYILARTIVRDWQEEGIEPDLEDVPILMKKKMVMTEKKRGITKVAQDQSICQDLEYVMRMMKMEMLRKPMGSIPGEGVGPIPPIVTTMMEQEMKRTGTMNALNQSITLAIHRMMIKVKDDKQSRKKHRSHHSSRMRPRSSKKHSNEENESDGDGRDHRHSRKKHRSQHSSGHGRNKHRHRNRHSSGDKKSRHHLKLDSSSDDEDQNHSSLDKNEKEINDERDELEEGEISSKVSEGSRGIASGHVSRETSVGALISHERATSQPPGTTSEVPVI